ncbi:S-Ena type endospore appendage, partial [Bacillus thuringiensis]
DNNTNMIINGTILVQNNRIIGIGTTTALTVNDTTVCGFVVRPGESRSITMNDINSIGIVGVGAGVNSSNVKISF